MLPTPLNVKAFLSNFSHFTLQNQPHLTLLHAQWKEARKMTLGASEIASAAGVVGAYESPYSLFIKKKRPELLMHTEMEHEALQWGTFYEPFARRELMDFVAPSVVDVHHPSLLLMNEDNNFSCSPDDILVWQHDQDDDGYLQYSRTTPILVEYKCPYSGQIPHVVPAHHYAQLLTNMFILQIKYALYVCWVPKTNMRVWLVPFNENSWNELYARAHHWMYSHCLPNVPPAKRMKPGTKLNFPELDDLEYIFDCYEFQKDNLPVSDMRRKITEVVFSKRL